MNNSSKPEETLGQMMLGAWLTQAIYVAAELGIADVLGNGPATVDFWLRKNGQDIPNSTVRCTIRSDDHKDVVVNQTMSAFKVGDKVSLMIAVEKTGEGLGIEAIRTQGRPLVPSIIFSMHKLKDSVDGYWRTTEKGTKKVWIESNT